MNLAKDTEKSPPSNILLHTHSILFIQYNYIVYFLKIRSERAHSRGRALTMSPILLRLSHFLDTHYHSFIPFSKTPLISLPRASDHPAHIRYQLSWPPVMPTCNTPREACAPRRERRPSGSVPASGRSSVLCQGGPSPPTRAGELYALPKTRQKGLGTNLECSR